MISKKKNRIISLALATSMLISVVHVFAFPDVQNHWAKADIMEMAAKGIINGRDATWFDPEANITRAEYVAIANRAFPEATSEKTKSMQFNDVKAGQWFYDEVYKSANAGLINGRDSTWFDPTAPITRQEAVVVTYNYLQKISFVFSNNSATQVNDMHKVADWAKSQVTQLVNSQIISGYEDGEFRPTNNITRAESAAIINRIFKKLPQSASPTPLVSEVPSAMPTPLPPTLEPGATAYPTATPLPTLAPGQTPYPSAMPTNIPTTTPTTMPTLAPGQTAYPTAAPTLLPTSVPTAAPSAVLTATPTATPTVAPTQAPATAAPTALPTAEPTNIPTASSTAMPTLPPGATAHPSSAPTAIPTILPTAKPSVAPTAVPTATPTARPTVVPTNIPTMVPTVIPTAMPTLPPEATAYPSAAPTAIQTLLPTARPSAAPTAGPSALPAASPSAVPTLAPSPIPTIIPVLLPTAIPTTIPTLHPTTTPTYPPLKPLQDSTWEEIAKAADIIASESLMASEIYDRFGWSIGDTKSYIFSGQTINAQIIGFNHDNKTDGTGKAGITFQNIELLSNTYQMDSSNNNIGGWNASDLRATLNTIIYSQIPQDLQDVIIGVDKLTASGGNQQGTTVIPSSDRLWLLSQQELAGTNGSSHAGEGAQYVYWLANNTNEDRIKSARWWTRSPTTANSFQYVCVTTGGVISPYVGSSSVSFAFCVGMPKTLQDSTWAKIAKASELISAEGMMASDVYEEFGWCLGDTKSFLMDGNTYHVRLIGINHDNKTGGGKAGLTFEMTSIYGTSAADLRKMNSSGTNTGGWEQSDMRNTVMPEMYGKLSPDLQNVIINVDKLTSEGNTSPVIVTSSDKLFLLSQVEVSGSNSNVFAGEGSIYAYFASNTSEVLIKERKNAGRSGPWFLRSPMSSQTTYFRDVSSGGAVGNGFAYASNNLGVSFAFCVGVLILE